MSHLLCSHLSFPASLLAVCSQTQIIAVRIPGEALSRTSPEVYEWLTELAGQALRKVLLTLDSGGSLGCQTAWHGITICWTPGQPTCVLHVCLLFIDLFQPVSLPTRLASPGSDYLISHLIYSSWLLCWSASHHRDKIPQMNNLRDEGSFGAPGFRRSVLNHLVPSLWAGDKDGYYGGE